MAALAFIEAVVREVPGVVGNQESLVEESHAAGLLEAPSYTKPADVARPQSAGRCFCPATTRRSLAGAATSRCDARRRSVLI